MRAPAVLCYARVSDSKYDREREALRFPVYDCNMILCGLKWNVLQTGQMDSYEGKYFACIFGCVF